MSVGINIGTIAQVSKFVSSSSCPSRTHPVAASSVQSTGLSYQSTASSLGTNISRLTGTPVDCSTLWNCINRLHPAAVDWSCTLDMQQSTDLWISRLVCTLDMHQSTPGFNNFDHALAT